MIYDKFMMDIYSQNMNPIVDIDYAFFSTQDS